MKTILEPQDIEAITNQLIEKLKPYLNQNIKMRGEDIVFDAQSLADYLKVDKSWVDKQVQLKSIPYFKCGKYNRFKKSAIDKWIDTETIRPLQPLQVIKSRG